MSWGGGKANTDHEMFVHLISWTCVLQNGAPWLCRGQQSNVTGFTSQAWTSTLLDGITTVFKGTGIPSTIFSVNVLPCFTASFSISSSTKRDVVLNYTPDWSRRALFVVAAVTCAVRFQSSIFMKPVYLWKPPHLHNLDNSTSPWQLHLTLTTPPHLDNSTSPLSDLIVKCSQSVFHKFPKNIFSAQTSSDVVSTVIWELICCRNDFNST